MRAFSSLVLLALASCVATAACGTSTRESFDPNAGKSNGFDSDAGGGPPTDRDPITCAEAAQARTYVGCDYWPTVTGNIVADIFDFAVVVSNSGEVAADVTVTGPNNVNQKVTVAPGSLEKIFLPWVMSLKGAGQSKAGESWSTLSASMITRKGAYHVVSSVPVVVYQFNPLEYKGQGGPAGKDWSSCPELGGPGTGCFSYSNDASLLLPSTAWTGTYRMMGIQGLSNPKVPSAPGVAGTYATVTASVNATLVKLVLGSKAQIVVGTEIKAGNPGETVEFGLDAGDVAQVVTTPGVNFDLSGSLLTANQPVQVISGIQCMNVPQDKLACDHLEETILPAEALGKQYVITTPTRPKGGTGLHVVRFIGNRDGTNLTYAPAKPEGCPDTLNAGTVAECAGVVSADFMVTGSQEFGVVSFMVGSTMYEANVAAALGDPSQTIFASTEQFRKRYLFLTPDDYAESHAVVVGPEAAAPTIDGQALPGYTALADGFGVWRVQLGPGNKGAHTLASTYPVGLQAMGYGSFTSYQFPGGLNVSLIAAAPTK